jgi:predicted DNA-binding ribbon-helix-helix protein
MKVTKVDERTYEVVLSEKKTDTIIFRLPPKESYELELLAINKKVTISSLVKEWTRNAINDNELLQEIIKEPDKSLEGKGKIKSIKTTIAFSKKIRGIAKKNGLTISELLRKIVLYNLRKIKQNK